MAARGLERDLMMHREAASGFSTEMLSVYFPSLLASKQWHTRATNGRGFT
jgi:hypothetical protein